MKGTWIFITLFLLGTQNALAWSLNAHVNAEYHNYRILDDSSSGSSLTLGMSEVDSLGAGVAECSIAPGRLSARAFGQLSTGASTVFGRAGGLVTASFSDIVVPTGGAKGTAGKIRPSMLVSGLLNSALTTSGNRTSEIPYSSWSLNISVSGVGNGSIQGYQDLAGYVGTSVPTVFQPSFDMIYGESYEIKVTLEVFAKAWVRYDSPGGWHAEAESDFSHTAKWEGASGTDAFGNSVPDFELRGTNGLDWAQPVPEPSTVSSLLIGISAGCLGYRKRQRRQVEK